MRITVFGSTGPTGRHLVGQAVAAGHDVVAVARREGALSHGERVRPALADVRDPDAVVEAVAGSDAVVSVIGTDFSRDPISVYSTGARTVLDAMDKHGVRRLAAVSSAIQDPNWQVDGHLLFTRVLDPLVNWRLGRTLHQDVARMETIVRESDVEWTLVRPSLLFEPTQPTAYRIDGPAGVFTARVDLASVLLRAVTEDDLVGRAVTVATTSPHPRLLPQLWREARSTR